MVGVVSLRLVGQAQVVLSQRLEEGHGLQNQHVPARAGIPDPDPGQQGAGGREHQHLHLNPGLTGEFVGDPAGVLRPVPRRGGTRYQRQQQGSAAGTQHRASSVGHPPLLARHSAGLPSASLVPHGRNLVNNAVAE